jgi:hypothetical protein
VGGGESSLAFREGYVNECFLVSARMGEGVGVGVGGAGPNGAGRVIPLVATAMLMAILNDR